MSRSNEMVPAETAPGSSAIASIRIKGRDRPDTPFHLFIPCPFNIPGYIPYDAGTLAPTPSRVKNSVNREKCPVRSAFAGSGGFRR